MPNILTHAVIADRVFENPTPDHLLGSTLHDFAGMSRDYLGLRVPMSEIKKPAALRKGLDMHIATNTAFNALGLRAELVEEGMADCLGTMPDMDEAIAKRVANIGTDILLDTAVVETEEGENVYKWLKQEIFAGNTALAGVAGVKFEGLVRAHFMLNRVYSYQNTALLAERIRERFALRGPRANIDERFDSGVALVLGRQLERIRPCAEELLDQTTEVLIPRFRTAA